VNRRTGVEVAAPRPRDTDEPPHPIRAALATPKQKPSAPVPLVDGLVALVLAALFIGMGLAALFAVPVANVSPEYRPPPPPPLAGAMFLAAGLACGARALQLLVVAARSGRSARRASDGR
jgi:hypothetical protein